MLSARLLRSLLPIGLAYFVAAALCLRLTRYDGGVAFVWFAASIAIAALRVRPGREWPALLMVCGAASALATGLFGLGWAFALPMAIVNAGEAAIGAELLRRFRHRKATVGTVAWLAEFVIPIGLVAPGVSAAAMVVVAYYAGLDPISAAIHYFCGHALGNLTFTPLTRLIALGGFRRIRRELMAHGWRELVGLLGSVAAVTLLVFGQESHPLLFLPLLPMVLVAFRLGFSGSALSIVIVTVVGDTLTLLGHGPIQLTGAPLGDQMQFFQFYLAAMAMTALPVAADLENRSALHRAMRISEERHRMLAEHSTDVLMHVDVAGYVRYISPAISGMTGVHPEDSIGKHGLTLIFEEDRQRVDEGHQAVIQAAGGTVNFEYRLITTSGKRPWVEASARLIVSDNGTIEGVMSVVRDISVRKATEDRLSKEAYTDTLTALPNRRSFEMAAARRGSGKAEGENDCVAVFDIDRFKRVNDRFGHDAGDAVLQSFARVLRGVVRRDDIIARIGGEEFIVLFPATAVPQALKLCERLREEMGKTLTEIGGHVIGVTVSGGVATLGTHGLDVALKQADQALYAAKRGGRDQMALAA